MSKEIDLKNYIVPFKKQNILSNWNKFFLSIIFITKLFYNQYFLIKNRYFLIIWFSKNFLYIFFILFSYYSYLSNKKIFVYNFFHNLFFGIIIYLMNSSFTIQINSEMLYMTKIFCKWSKTTFKYLLTVKFNF